MSLSLQKNWQKKKSRRLSKPVGVLLAQISALKEHAIIFKVYTFDCTCHFCHNATRKQSELKK